jgi:hypothetical protein
MRSSGGARLPSVLTSQITSRPEAEKEAAIVLIPNPAAECLGVSGLKNSQPYAIIPDNALELRYESLPCNKSAPFIRNS